MRCLVLLATMAFAVSACSDDPKAASKQNFQSAINAYIQQQPACLSIPRSGVKPDGESPPAFPRYVSIAPATTELPRQNLQQAQASFEALVEAGLMSAAETTIKVSDLWGRRAVDVPVRAYSLTAEGQKALSVVGEQTAFMSPDQRLCYGKPTVDDVIRFTEPAEMMGMKVSHVSYRYRLADVPAWARHPAMQAAFPQLQRDTAGPLEAKAAVVMTSEGWIHEAAFQR